MPKKRVIIVHGWDASPEMHWFPWLKKEMEKRNYEVIVPQMPGGENPRLGEWMEKLKEVIPDPDKNTYFVGHSLGCIAVCHYLSLLPFGTKIGGCIFVAGFLRDIEPELDNFCVPFDIGKVKGICENFAIVANRDDDVVPFERSLEMQNKLKAKMVLQDGKGHFNADDGVTELPVVIEELMKMRQK